jgi:hypothetical protein
VLNGHGGTASIIDPIGDGQLPRYSTQVIQNTPYDDEKLAAPPTTSPIERVIYIVAGSRPYADLARTRNQQKLAQEFVRLDNFHAMGRSRADGLHWSVSGIVPDYVQKLWPATAAGRRKLFDYDGADPAAVPAAGYLWSNARSAGLTVRNYGVHVTNRAQPGADGVQVETVTDPALRPFTNLQFRGFDPSYSDMERAKVFLRDLEAFEKSGDMPRLTLIRLSGAADYDQALGTLVEAISRSRFWPTAAVFVVPTDTGAVSSRAIALAASPYARRGAVDNTFYNNASVLRTIEVILALQPLTMYDAASTPLAAAFQAQPDLRPFTAEPRAQAAAETLVAH